MESSAPNLTIRRFHQLGANTSNCIYVLQLPAGDIHKQSLYDLVRLTIKSLFYIIEILSCCYPDRSSPYRMNQLDYYLSELLPIS